MFNDKEIVLDFVKREGPVLPIQVAKQTKSNTMFAGAILSELIANNLIKISHAKIGGSPVYYVNGQEEKLSILYDHLPGKEKEAFALLRNNKVLLDEYQEPAIRFALSQIKDFSTPFFVNIKNINIKAWRWHLVPEEEAVQIVKNSFKEQVEVKESIKPDMEKAESKEIQKANEIKKPKEKSRFFEHVNSFLERHKISVLHEEIIRKNKEINLTVKLNSSLGELIYLIKATDKKSLNEKDVIYAFNHGNLKKMPVILLSKGKLSKKAEKYIKENLEGYLTFRALE